MNKEVIIDLKTTLASLGIDTENKIKKMCTDAKVNTYHFKMILKNNPKYTNIVYMKEILKKINKYLNLEKEKYSKAIHHIERILEYGL